MRATVLLRRSASRSLALVVALLLLLAGAVPMVAGTSPAGVVGYRPDGWVRYYSYHQDGGGTFVDPRPWKGNDIYNQTGKHQTAIERNIASVGLEGNWDMFQVKLENDGLPDRFRVHATGPGDWVVQYFRGSENVTAKVVGGTFMTRSLANGEAVILKVKVWIGDVGTSVKRRITITSVGDPDRSDVVRIWDSFEGCGC